MTTTDPALRREIREASYRGSATAAVRLSLATAATLLSGGLLSLAAGAFVGQFRTMAVLGINETNTWFDNGLPLWLFIVLSFLSIPATILSTSGYLRWNHRYSGRPDRILGPGGPTLVMIGFSAAAWVTGLVLWAEPETVGATDGTDWGLVAWTAYRMKVWGPALITAVTVLTGVLGITARRGREGMRADVTDLLTTGRRVTGEVTEVSGVPSPEASKTQLSWTFRFTDDAGRQRWVERTEFFTVAAHPTAGDPVWVLFDPAEPGNTTRVYASLTDSSDPADFLHRGII